MSEAFTVRPIGVVRSTRDQPDDDGWDAEQMSIELTDEFAAGLQGLDAFSHAMVVFLFDRAGWDESRLVRHPRGNTAWPQVGIFAQRAKDRPNRIGVSTCEILGIDGGVLRLRGLDAIDGTPVLDIKPHMAEFSVRGSEYQPSWATELMQGYW